MDLEKEKIAFLKNNRCAKMHNEEFIEKYDAIGKVKVESKDSIAAMKKPIACGDCDSETNLKEDCGSCWATDYATQWITATLISTTQLELNQAKASLINSDCVLQHVEGELAEANKEIEKLNKAILNHLEIESSNGRTFKSMNSKLTEANKNLKDSNGHILELIAKIATMGTENVLEFIKGFEDIYGVTEQVDFLSKQD